MQFVLLQSSEGAQSHVDDFTCLNLIEVETHHEVVHRLLWIFGSTDDVYHFVNVVAGNDETFEDV